MKFPQCAKCRDLEAQLKGPLSNICGALSNLGHEIARSTIAEILERHPVK